MHDLSITCNNLAITIGPVSLTVLPGVNSQFHCGGTGVILTWEVDGLSHNFAVIKQRGISAATVTTSGTIQSNLTVPATSENNGTTVRCAIGETFISIPVLSNYSSLTVLSGEVYIFSVQNFE